MRMNRLVIIGNGFDLAHGLETSYTHFINHFWEQEKGKVSISNLNQRLDTNNDRPFGYDCVNYTIFTKTPFDLRDTKDILGSDWFNCLRTPQDGTLRMKNVFLDVISQKNNQRWVDIEVEYYKRLCSCLEEKFRKRVGELNLEFSIIKTALEDYLKHMLKKCLVRTGYDTNCFYKKISNDENTFAEMLFLNFNYTHTIDQYVSRHDSIINIHGNLDDPNNPIIFGYGDEMDERHNLIENSFDNEFLKYIKTIEYLNTDNYSRLQTFIEMGDYEVLIAGHSCGLSDRTLLNHLFEHTHCKKIRIFYHELGDGTDNFKDILYNVYRCFNNKSRMRGIVECKKNSWTLQTLLEKKVRKKAKPTTNIKGSPA